MKSQTWACNKGRSNSSTEYFVLKEEIGHIIKCSARELLNGGASTVAGLILAQLTYKYDMHIPLDAAEIIKRIDRDIKCF